MGKKTNQQILLDALKKMDSVTSSYARNELCLTSPGSIVCALLKKGVMIKSEKIIENKRVIARYSLDKKLDPDSNLLNTLMYRLVNPGECVKQS